MEKKIFPLEEKSRKTKKYIFTASYLMNYYISPFSLTVSPPMSGSIPGMNSEFSPLQSAPSSQPTIITPPHTSIIPPIGPQPTSASYLPPFHFPHPDFLTKNPFIPYDLTHLRGVVNGRPMHHLHHTTSTTQILSQTPLSTSASSIEHVNSSRLSPASSRPSSSSPPSSAHSIKLNASIEIQSMHESDDSDDEQIDVVKSAFVPILRPSPTNNQSIVRIPDSTVQEPISTERSRCELKAPSSRKPVHETAPIGPRSPETKIKSPISAQKTVWRPY